LFIGGQPVDRAANYTATFVTTQGVPPKFGTNRRDLSLRAVDALAAYLASALEIAAPLRETFVVV